MNERAREIGEKHLDRAVEVELPQGGKILIVPPDLFEELVFLVHDSRIVLSSIMGYAELLEMELEGSKRYLAHSIKREADFLKRLFDDVLLLEKIRNGMKKPTITEFGICELLEEIVDFLEPISRDREKNLSLECEDFEVRSDRDLIFRAVLNVVENALRHSKGDVSVKSGGGMIEVEDTGPALRKSDLGKGFGLEIARELISRIGGEVEVETREGGNTVRMNLKGMVV